MHVKEVDVTATRDIIAKNGKSFHWDKDENLRSLMGGSMYIHPHLSTVTDMKLVGSPTMVLDLQVHPLTCDLSWPEREKQLSDDGRSLHAAPGDLIEMAIRNTEMEMII